MGDTINVGIVGASFMGRAHSNAYKDVNSYFELPKQPVLKAVCDISQTAAESLAKKYGWQSTENAWGQLIARDDIDLIDICTSNKTHMPIAVAAAKAGKHVISEKPLAMNASECRKMLDAVQEAGVRHMVAHNYRRVPAIILAKKLIDEGKIGKVFHVNAVYLQDWLVDPGSPFVWRHDAKEGGSGAHGDLNAHIIDLSRYLVGEIDAVSASQETFIKERKKADGSMGKVTVDDALQFICRFRDGAMGNFLSTRFATGRKNYLRLEIFGSEGGLVFNLERLNELEYYSRNDDPHAQGYRNIMVTENIHPYLNRWWPPGHIIGWEHTFIHEIGDMLLAISKGENVAPNFYDGLRCQLVLDAALTSAEKGKWVDVPAK